MKTVIANHPDIHTFKECPQGALYMKRGFSEDGRNMTTWTRERTNAVHRREFYFVSYWVVNAL